MLEINIIILRVFLESIFTFIIAIIISQPLIAWMSKNSIWKKKSVQKTIDGKDAVLTKAINNDEDKKLLRMGGLLIYFSVLISIILSWLIAKYFKGDWVMLDFISRKQTWIPVFTFFIGGILGAIDDLLVVEYWGNKIGGHIGGGLSLFKRFFIVIPVSIFIAYWFVYKLGMESILIPFYGLLIVPGIVMFLFVAFMIISTYMGSVIDGVDGLSGGIFIFIYTAFGVIAMIRNSFDIATLCFVIVAALLVFLWFNLPPARFMNGEAGMSALLLTITVIAFLLNAIILLPVIGAIIYVTIGSSVIQIISKKFFKKKAFPIAPLHNYFHLIGWPPHLISMRYWIVSYCLAVLGIILSVL